MNYKEILKGIVQIINTTEKSDIGFANICTYIGNNCPELKESEDERIRKELIDYINRLTVTPNNIDRYNAWITWLEKQGEKKSIFDFNANNWYVSKVDGKIHNIYNSGVEPKFHEGTTITIPKDLKGTDTDGGVVGEKGEQGEQPTNKNFKERYDNIAKSDWFKKTHKDISIGEEQPTEEEMVGMGGLGKVWREQAIISRLDKIIELLQSNTKGGGE